MLMATSNRCVNIFDRSGVLQQLEQWAALESNNCSARKTLVSFRAARVVQLIGAA